MRIRITFSKTAAMRYTGHLDLHRAWERTFRRAGLPLAYSQGFHPQPLGQKIGMGFYGKNRLRISRSTAVAAGIIIRIDGITLD